MTPELDLRWSTFLRRWHSHEATLGPKAGLVIDFDMGPHRGEGLAPFADRAEALREGMALQAALGDAAGAPNPAFARARVAGHLAYLRGLLGERRPFADMMRAMMGMLPAAAPPDALAAARAALQDELGARGIAWSSAGMATFDAQLRRPGMAGFGDELRAEARGWLDLLRARLPDLPDVHYRIEDAAVDAYWSNWIDGSVEDGVRLRVNTHPRISYQTVSPRSLAAHEIAGHAVHVACLRRSQAAGRLPASALSLTVHALEAFQMEGIAQAMGHLLAGGEAGLGADLALVERLRAYHGARVNLAHLQLEDGAPIDAVWAALEADCPLLSPASARAGLRDRGRDPLFRTYIAVYAPSRALLLRALDLPRPAQDRLLRAVLDELWTPGQLAHLVDGADPDAVRREDPPPPAL
jgi:hypothetical protein